MRYQVHFYRVKYHPFSVAILCGLYGCFLKMSVKSNEIEMDKNGCSYLVSSVVTIEFILRLHRCLLLVAIFRQFVKHKTAL